MSGLADLPGLVEKHKRVIGVAGAVVVGGLALAQARKRDAGGKDAAPAAAAAPVARSLSSGGAPIYGSPAGYTADTTTSDLYNALQPYFEKLEQQTATPAVPVPTFAPGFYGRAGGDGLYQVDAAGNRDWLDMPEWLALTNNGANEPKVTKVAKDNVFWTATKQSGPDGGTWK